MSDPLAELGQNFGRTVDAFCDFHTLLVSGMVVTAALATEPERLTDLSQKELCELNIYQRLLRMAPILEEKLSNASSQDILEIAHLLQKGSRFVTMDDARVLKGDVLKWLTPPGVILVPYLHCDVKTNRGFHHAVTGSLLCPAHLDWSDNHTREALRAGELRPNPAEHWPIFIYQDYLYVSGHPWNGLFRSYLLVTAYKRIFMCTPGTAMGKPATSRAVTHLVTPASIAYTATQVRHALSSSAVFFRSDTLAASEAFYRSILNFFFIFEHAEEIRDLLDWWNG
ncbi:hypothetical protein FPV67DRAFT_1429143 [Lyophyllum atratum]|nr:hypothetical protein FPV67DRAFT_1429143 [Lyophyllum atratum]